jgi:2-phospho-L-lactate/phosphoenolpyruvate guanylyltransferase
MTGTATQMPTWALVPLKSPQRAKSRLAGVLSGEQRVRLFFALAERVISTLRLTPGVDAVAVVTASSEIASFVQSLGATPLVQPMDTGMTAALQSGLNSLQSFNPARVLMVPGDLPLISTSAVQSFIDASSHGVVLVPDRHRVGTNVLLCAPPCAIAPSFGGHSFARHLAAASTAGLVAHVVTNDALALDLDEPDDLAQLQLADSSEAARLFDAIRIDMSERRAAVTG